MPFVSTRGGRLYYEVHDLTAPWVERPAAIVFHHGAAANLHAWNEWLPHFCQGYRLVVFDARGCGRSTVPGPGFEWSMEQLAADVLDVALAAGANRFHFVGEGLGGTLGLQLAVKYGDRPLTVSAASCSARSGIARQAADWRGLIEAEGQRGWAEQMMSWRFFPDALAPAQRDWWLRQHAGCNAHAALVMNDIAAETDLTPYLPEIRVPVLLLCPDASPFVPPSHMAEIQAAIPGAEMQVFAHARHGLVTSHASACAQVVSAFIARNFSRAKADLPVII